MSALKNGSSSMRTKRRVNLGAAALFIAFGVVAMVGGAPVVPTVPVVLLGAATAALGALPGRGPEA